jgi:hypothetical protein
MVAFLTAAAAAVAAPIIKNVFSKNKNSNNDERGNDNDGQEIKATQKASQTAQNLANGNEVKAKLILAAAKELAKQEGKSKVTPTEVIDAYKTMQENRTEQTKATQDQFQLANLPQNLSNTQWGKIGDYKLDPSSVIKTYVQPVNSELTSITRQTFNTPNGTYSKTTLKGTTNK